MNREDIAWAAGLFEGEGCITVSTRRMKYVNLTLAMCDRDAVERFRDAVGVGTIRLRRKAPQGGKPLWIWSANSFEHAQAVVARLWPGLCSRRRSRAREILLAVQASQRLRLTNRQMESCSIADCELRPVARNLCGKHYLSATRSERYARTGNVCVESGCERSPNGSRGRCRPHADEARALVG